MPFRTGARLTIENLSERPVTVYYQITYETGDDHGRRRVSARPVAAQQSAGGADDPHDRRRRRGRPGTTSGPTSRGACNSNGWWGEGEIKFYLDDDEDYPTICGTGTEDYFGGAWNFDVPGRGYTEFSTPYLGMPQVIRPDGLYVSQQRFGMYRFHVLDPIRFAEPAAGRHPGARLAQRRPLPAAAGRHRSTAFFYLDRPAAHRPRRRPPTPWRSADGRARAVGRKPERDPLTLTGP